VGVPAPTTTPRRLGRQPALDGIRGIAWCVVFCSHAFVLPLAVGQPCMFVFFALSGFLITSLVVEERWSTGRVSLSNFFARRSLRLLPALAFFLAGWVVVVVAAGGHAPWTTSVPGGTPISGTPAHAALEGVGAAALYLTNWADVASWFTTYVPLGHLWSLAVEEQFYLLWAPVVVLLLACGRRRLVVWAAALAATASFADVAWRDGNGFSLTLDMSTDTRAGAFLVGAGLAMAWSRRARWLGFVQTPQRHLATASALGVLAWSSWAFTHRVPRPVFTLTWVAVSFAAGLLVVSVLGQRPGRRGLVGSAAAGYIGRRSYALYLWHYVWLTWLAGLGLAAVPLALGATFACAELSWRLVEKQALARRSRFAATSATPALVTALPAAGRAPAVSTRVAA
jgi:peptidoglycan/LPS O-acetylase OafA/YrhL